MNHKDLDVWKESVDFVTEIYKLIQNFPQSEQYGLSSQIKRSAISIPANIAEVCARQSDKETIQFLYVAVGSIAELETELLIAQKLNFIQNIENK